MLLLVFWFQLFGPLCESFTFIATPLDQTDAYHFYWFFRTNLRANLILLLQCNPIQYSEFSDSVFLGEKFISLRPLVQYAWNLAKMCTHESSNCCEIFGSFGLHLISQINFLSQLLEFENSSAEADRIQLKTNFLLNQSTCQLYSNKYYMCLACSQSFRPIHQYLNFQIHAWRQSIQNFNFLDRFDNSQFFSSSCPILRWIWLRILTRCYFHSVLLLILVVLWILPI